MYTFDALDAALLDGYQSGVPVSERPFHAVAEAVDAELAITVEPEDVVDRIQGYVENGLVRRFGPVLNPSAIGASTLAALRVPSDDVADVAAVVNRYPEVSHNYRRDHEWNVWFVASARSEADLDRLLAAIGSETGYEPLSLPKQRTYCVDMQFPVVGELSNGDCRQSHTAADAAPLTVADRELLAAVQDGVPVSPTPFNGVAADLGRDGTAVVAALDRLFEDGYLKRFGLIVDHHAFGFRNNAMLAWAVPSDTIDAVGERVGRLPYVTKCYRRPRRPERGWEYTLFTMLHGRNSTRIDEQVETLAHEYVPYPFVRLETVERLKQTGTRYGKLLSPEDRFLWQR